MDKSARGHHSMTGHFGDAHRGDNPHGVRTFLMGFIVPTSRRFENIVTGSCNYGPQLSSADALDV
jgi:hypothetical protein